MPLIERFFQKVDKSGNLDFPECWLWTGGKTSKGYGSFSYYQGRSAIGAHVSSHLFHLGEIPNGMRVCHSCDNPPCVNPEHLFLGTNSDNMKDMFSKGRNGSSSRRRTHCRKGHSFEEFGVYERTGRGGRICRECQRNKALQKRNSPETRDALLKYQRDYQREYYRKNNKKI